MLLSRLYTPRAKTVIEGANVNRKLLFSSLNRLSLWIDTMMEGVRLGQCQQATVLPHSAVTQGDEEVASLSVSRKNEQKASWGLG